MRGHMPCVCLLHHVSATRFVYHVENAVNLLRHLDQ